MRRNIICRIYLHSFSVFTFFSPSAASAVPILLPASCPEACEPIMLEFVASAKAAFVSSDTGGGFPLIAPVLSPTKQRLDQYTEFLSDNAGSILGLEEAEFVAIVARGEWKWKCRSESFGGDLRTWNALQRNFDVVPVIERSGCVECEEWKLELCASLSEILFGLRCDDSMLEMQRQMPLLAVIRLW